MTCYRPNKAVFFAAGGSPLIVYPDRVVDGARQWPSHNFLLHHYSAHRRARGLPIKLGTLPCGVCFGCRSDNARGWALRMMHESRYHESTCFVTLTYNDDHLPEYGDLRYEDLTKFWKDCRHVFQSPGQPFKYFVCGEYGDKSLRPHYHFAGFSFQIPDLRFFKKHNGNPYFISDTMTDVWGKGHVIIGDLSTQSAAYIARYVNKKMHGGNIRDLPDTAINARTGEVGQYTIERAFQSKGLGFSFYQQYKDDIWDKDGCLYNNKYMVKPPRYYFKMLEAEDPDRAEEIRLARLKERPQRSLDFARDKELLYTHQAKKLEYSALLKRSL